MAMTSRRRPMGPRLRPLLPLLVLLALELTQAAPPLQPPQQPQDASATANAAPQPSGPTSPDARDAAAAATTLLKSATTTASPDNDLNKELLDYDDSFLQGLQFLVPAQQTGPTQAQQQSQEDYVRGLVNKYHDQDELYAYLVKLTQDYPQLTRLYDIGSSVEGRKLWALEISERPGEHEPLKPEFRYVANIHGNEAVGRELLLHLGRLILDNYKLALQEEQQEASQPKGTPVRPSGPKFIRKLVKATRIHLLPSANPDGFARSHVACMYERPSKLGRLNANNIDLNRNFPDKAQDGRPDAATQPEVRALMDWSKRVPFVLSANLHGGAVVASIPYDSSLNKSTENQPDERRTPDHETYLRLASAYALSHPTMHKGEMCYDKCTDYHPEVFPGGVTTGSGWYQFHGSFQDWAYDNTNDFHVTLEIGCNQYPPPEALEQYWAFNKAPLLNYMRQVHRGIKGQVSDAVSGRPLDGVKVRVLNIDHDVTTTAAGDFFRLLSPGTYEILFDRAHYQQVQISVRTDSTMAQIHNIQMRPLDAAAVGGGGGGGGGDSLASLPAAGHEDDVALEVAPPVEPHGSVAVATLVMSVITVLLLLLLAGAYVIQKRRFLRSQSISVELQPASRHHATSTTTTTGRSQSSGISLPPPITGSKASSGLSPNVSA